MGAGFAIAWVRGDESGALHEGSGVEDVGDYCVLLTCEARCEEFGAAWLLGWVCDIWEETIRCPELARKATFSAEDRLTLLNCRWE